MLRLYKPLKKITKKFLSAIAHIKVTSNNTAITITDLNGNVICRGSAGEYGFKGAKKNTPFAAQTVAKNVCVKAKEFGVENLIIKFNGQNESKIFVLQIFLTFNFFINKITYNLKVPFNGCRPPKRRKL